MKMFESKSITIQYFKGGATTFKDLNIQVKPQKGKALIFFPCTVDGVPDDRTMHAGQVCFDTKWIAQM